MRRSAQEKITMQELARLADVDVSTVSRALSDSPLVKPDTKANILRIATETGYVVNASARSLRRRSSQTIGLVVPIRPESGQTISDPFYLEMVGAISHAASEKGYDLIISVPHGEQQIAERRLLQTGRADGLIVIGQAGRAERLNSLGDQARNVVVWGGRLGKLKYTLVGSDNLEGGRLAGEHLLHLGRKRVLFLGNVSLPEVALRYEGLQQAYKERRRTHDSSDVLKLDFGGDAAIDAVVGRIELGPAFDAIFAASDVLAMSAIHALNSKGIAVPEDVSVVGYDNIGQAAMMTPTLTTIDQNIRRGGETMVDLLLRKIAGEQVKSILLPTRLVVRRSCGASPA